MDEQQYNVWWQLHRRSAVGEQLSDEEQRAYQAGLAELEAEEWAERRPAAEILRPLQAEQRIAPPPAEAMASRGGDFASVARADAGA